MKSREEIRFLTLLAKTQDKTSKLKKLPVNSEEIHETNGDSCADEWRLPKVPIHFKLESKDVVRCFLGLTSHFSIFQ